MVNPISDSATALIVDDSATIRGTLKAFLSLAGVEVVGQESSGLKLLQTIAQLSPDIICLDYNLPGVNGLELLKSIVSECPTIAVVMVTGELDPGLRGVAAEAGAAGFIQKPFTQEQVAKEIKSVIHAKRLHARTQKNAVRTVTAGASPAKKTALIADDSRTMRELLKVILSSRNIDVVAEATSGTLAVELAIKLRPDLVCLDIDMPGMDGLDALLEIRQKVSSSRVLMISGNSKRESVLFAIKQGAAGFILKPFEPDKVTEAITKILGV